MINARLATAVVANSSTATEAWRSQLRASAPCHYVPNAVPASEIQQVKAATRQDLDVDENCRIILAASRFAPQKRWPLLIDALAQILPDNNYMAVLCGQGPQRDRVRQMVSARGLEPKVRMPGYVSDLWAWMKAADVFVNISAYEGCPNTVLEAMACRCPVVVSDIPAHREILDEEEGLIVGGEDPVNIAKSIQEVVDAPAKWQAIAGSVGRTVRERSPSRTANGYQHVYETILK